MNGLIVRFLILSVSLYLFIAIICGWSGIDIYKLDYIFGHSLIFDVTLTLCCCSDKKYHCRYMRYLCYNFVLVDILGFADSNFLIFKDAVILLAVLTVSWVITTLITIFLALRHYSRSRNLIKQRHHGNR